jgi:hypothetical protein
VGKHYFADVMNEGGGEGEVGIDTGGSGDEFAGNGGGERMIPKVSALERVGVLRVVQDGRRDDAHEHAMNFFETDAEDGLLNIFGTVGLRVSGAVPDAQDIRGQARIHPDKIGEGIGVRFHVFEQQQQFWQELERRRQEIGIRYKIVNLSH